MSLRAWIIAIIAAVLVIALIAFARGPEVHDGVRGTTAAAFPAFVWLRS